MKFTNTRRVAGLFGGAALFAGLLAAPSPALAEVTTVAAPSTATAETCTLTGASLTWGLKESFRSYISGSIANGSWEATDGAEYEIPNFIWRNGTGDFNPESGTGSISFTGTLHFSGHDGVLDLTLANPTIEFEGDGTAALLLDARSNDMEGELVIDEKQEWVGEISVPESFGVQDDVLELSDLPVTLTNSGAGAFAGFYEAGAELDPIFLNVEFDGCADSAPASAGSLAGSDSASGDVADVTAAENDTMIAGVPWLPIGIGGVALLVIGFTVGLIVGGRRGRQAS